MVVFMNRIAFVIVNILFFSLLIPSPVRAQISAPGASGSDKTNYPVFSETDSIYIFCSASEGENNAVLRAQTDWIGSKTFLWEKYNNLSASFELYISESTENQTSEISGLADGCYRVTITQAANSVIKRAWVFNNWFTSEGNVSESNCFSFRLNGAFTSSELKYYDLSNNAELTVFKDVKVQWKVGETQVATVINPQIYSPPPRNTEYTLRVYDKFGCQSLTNVMYESIVTLAKFTADPLTGEAPLIVTFNNQSENGDLDQFEWFFFRNLDDIKRESEGTTGEVDSIMVVAYDESPVYTFESSGSYMVKLVSKKISELHTCVDTAYLEDYIVADSSFIAVPNVFTPNGDGTNDEFVVKFWSMKSIEISIFNRWGKRIQYWESGDVRGFENTYTETVWDGRLMGGKFASPGVYYYNVVGIGRDGERRRAHGFFHLFRDKD